MAPTAVRELGTGHGGPVGAEPTLRPAGPADLEAVERILESAKLPTAGVAEALGSFVVAESGGHLVAVAGLEVHDGDGILRSVAVDPIVRGRGLGRRLTDRIIGAARDSGLRGLYLLTTTAEEYFLRHGFRRIERQDAPPAVQRSVEFREACPASAVAMALELERSSGRTDGGAPDAG